MKKVIILRVVVTMHDDEGCKLLVSNNQYEVNDIEAEKARIKKDYKEKVNVDLTHQVI